MITIYSIIRTDGTGIFDRLIQRLVEEGIIVNHPVYGYQMGNQFFEHHPKVLKNLVDSDTLRRLYDFIN